MEDKGIQIHQFDPAVYPRNLWVCIGANPETIRKHFRLEKEESDISFDATDKAFGISVISRESGQYGILFVFRDRKAMSVGAIAHESVHAADYIFEEIHAFAQDFRDKNEPYAYLVEWAAKCMNGVRLNKFPE